MHWRIHPSRWWYYNFSHHVYQSVGASQHLVFDLVLSDRENISHQLSISHLQTEDNLFLLNDLRSKVHLPACALGPISSSSFHLPSPIFLSFCSLLVTSSQLINIHLYHPKILPSTYFCSSSQCQNPLHYIAMNTFTLTDAHSHTNINESLFPIPFLLFSPLKLGLCPYNFMGTVLIKVNNDFLVVKSTKTFLTIYYSFSLSIWNYWSLPLCWIFLLWLSWLYSSYFTASHLEDLSSSLTSYC